MRKCLILILNACIAAITLATLRYYMVTKPVLSNDLRIHLQQKPDSEYYSQWPFSAKQDPLINSQIHVINDREYTF